MPNRSHPASTACPDPQELAAYFRAELPPPARQKIEAHLPACSDCRSAAGELGQGSGHPLWKFLADAARSDAREDAPRPTRTRRPSDSASTRCSSASAAAGWAPSTAGGTR